MKLGERIAELREENGLTQQELAKKMNVKREMINYYENGKRQPKVKDILKMAEIFAVQTDQILLGIECKKASNREINSRLGLSDNAIEVLETWAKDKNDSRSTELLNYFFKNSLITELIIDFRQGLDKLCMAELSRYEIKLESLVEIIKIKLGGKFLRKLDESFDEYLPKCKREQDEWLPSALPENTSTWGRGEIL